MANTVSGPYTETSWVAGSTALNQTNMNNLETQSKVALASINPDIAASGFILSGCAATRHNSYSSNVLTDTPLRYYRLDETSGTTVVDSGSGLVNGVTHASPTMGVAGLLTGDPDTCYTFASASSQYISTDSTGLPTASAAHFSMEAWIKFAANPVAVQDFMSLGDVDTANGHAILQLTTTGFVKFFSVSGFSVTSNAALSTGAAHHVVGTYDGTTARLYVDGALQAATATVTIALVYAGSYPFTIGSDSTGNAHLSAVGGFFSGQIDEVAFYTSALSGTRILAHYTAGTTATTQVDIASGKAYLIQSDGTNAGCVVTSTTQTTATINTTYYLYLQPDGSWYWSTSNAPAANSVAIATITTDGAGNVNVVTDARPVNVPLYASASAVSVPGLASIPKLGGQTTAGVLGVPVIVAQALNTHITTTTSTQVLTFKPPVAGLYRMSMSAYIGNATNPSTITADIHYTEPNSGTTQTHFFTIQSATAGTTNPVTLFSASIPTTNAIAAYSIIAYAGTGSAIDITYHDASGTPNDWVSAIIERLS